MTLAQTNLQLYNQLIELGWGESDLEIVRTGYDVARSLFAGAFRPSHKPFLSHLVGVASALALWEQKPEVVVAGMLHSCYLYGAFSDGESGVTEKRRDYIRSRVGAPAEELAYQYTMDDGVEAFGSENPQVALVKIADFFDELVDRGPAYAANKPLSELKSFSPEDISETLQAATPYLGVESARKLEALIRHVVESNIPEVLQTKERSFFRVKCGVEALQRDRKKSVGRRLRKFLGLKK